MIDLGKLDDLRILDDNGVVVDSEREPKLEAGELLRMYRGMVLTRAFDQRMLTMQRQGQMGTFAPGLGQEATQIGQVYPLLSTDWYSPSYRSFGAQIWRGWKMDQLMLLWDGYFSGFEIPEANELPFSIVIGSHVPPAVGIGMAMRAKGDKGVVLVNFGDGALSQGAIAEAMNFASVYKSPVIFVCENNGYAISTKTEHQSGLRELARRGSGFGIASARVDGNDLLAMTVATQRAVDFARAGNGPCFIEAVTYRMSVHTTADDPKVYRSDDELVDWEKKCPIARFERYLSRKGLLDPGKIDSIKTECDEEVLEAREQFRAKAKVDPREIFDYMFETLPPEMLAQKQDYFDRLDRKGI